jgi:hypothetical protein
LIICGGKVHSLFDLLKNILDFQVHLKAYVCPLFKQNGGDGLFKGEDNLIPQ